MIFSDRLAFDATRRTTDGFLVTRANAARTGVYQYAGSEVDPDNAHGLRDEASVNVLRDAEHVFAKRSLASFVGKPITDDHPTEAVTASNWRDHARGIITGAVKDGDHVGFDLAFMDAATIAKIDAGKVELSNGYDAKLEFGDFTAADGTKCQVRQTDIRGNHIALVDRGRAGSSCRVIADAAPCAAAPQTIFDSLTIREKPVTTMVIDGLTVDLGNADTAKATLATIIAARDEAKGKVSGLEGQVATLTTDKATLEGKVADLTQKLSDAKPTLTQLVDAAKSYASAVSKAKALGVAITDAMDEPAIVKAVVDAKLKPELRTGWNDAQYAASYAALTADVKVADTDPLANVISNGIVSVGDAASIYDTARNAHKASLRDAWRKPFNAAEPA